MTTAPHPPQEQSTLEYLEENLLAKDGLHLIVKNQEKWVRLTDITDILSQYDESRPSPAPAKTAQECENRNCLECPLWEGCHVMVDMPMCARATYDNVAKNAARQAREEAEALFSETTLERVRRHTREDLLDKLLRWCNDNWHGAFIIQYEKQLTEQVVDLVRLKAKIKSLRQQAGDHHD